MPMTGLGLKNAIKAATNPPTGFDDAQLLVVCNAIVQYIQANATVAVTGTATGVTTGPSSAPVTGSGTIA